MKKIFNQKEFKNIRMSLRKNLSSPEKILWQKIREKQLAGNRFRRQHGIGDYIVDFYCPSKKVVIEIDGDNHFTSVGKAKDKIRDNYFTSLGILVLRFTNKEIIENVDGVLERIIKIINPT